MSAGLRTRPQATTYELAELVDAAWRGEIRVPSFQRGLRWGSQDVLRLFDSIVRGYPVGSILLWVRSAPEEQVRLGDLEIDAARLDEAFWVVDGQQRVTSLANALSPSVRPGSRFALGYDLDGERFVPYREPGTPGVIPLPDLFDLGRLIAWFAEHPEVPDGLQRATEITSTIRQFKIPAYLVKQDDEDVLRDIFDRMNNYGKRLSRAEVFSALHPGGDGGQGGSVEHIAERIDAGSGFGLLDGGTVMQALLARRGPDITREVRIEFDDRDRRGTVDFPGERREDAYRAVEEALGRAVVFLQETAGVPHLGFLAYRYLLIVLTRFFAHHPNAGRRNLELLRRWYWRAALVGLGVPGGSGTQTTRLLCAAVRPGDASDSVQRLLTHTGREAPPLPTLERFRTNGAATRISLCAWWALEPRSPTTGEVYGRAQLSACLEGRTTAANAVRPLVRGRAVPEPMRRWAAVQVLLPDPEEGSDELSERFVDLIWKGGSDDQGAPDAAEATPAAEHLPGADGQGAWNEVLRSHGLTRESLQLLATGDVETFLRERQSKLQATLEVFLKARCEWDFEDTPPLEELDLDEEDWDEDGDEQV